MFSYDMDSVVPDCNHVLPLSTYPKAYSHNSFTSLPLKKSIPKDWATLPIKSWDIPSSILFSRVLIFSKCLVYNQISSKNSPTI